MTISDLLSRLDGVKPRGAGKFVGRCPAHPDRSPSLSVAEGHKGILLRCWAGCALAEICVALQLQPKDLFYDTLADPAQRRAAAQERGRRRRERERQQEADGLASDCLKAAERFLESRTGLDITGWSDQRLDEELTLVAAALAILEAENDED